MRLSPSLRKMQMLFVAASVARDKGYRNVTRQDVSRRAKCSISLVSYHFKSSAKLHSAIMATAIETRDLDILAQGLVARDPIALSAPRALRAKALRGVMV